MSFSIQTAPADPSAVREAIEAAFDAAPQAKETAAELAAVIADYVELVAPTLARPGDQVIVSAYGHWNGSGEPVKGWASNALTIGVTQVYAKTDEVAP